MEGGLIVDEKTASLEMQHPDPIRRQDFVGAIIAGLLAWVITFASKLIFSI
jgi:hypothetical protein